MIPQTLFSATTGAAAAFPPGTLSPEVLITSTLTDRATIAVTVDTGKTYTIAIQGADISGGTWHTIASITDAFSLGPLSGATDSAYIEVPAFPVMRLSITARDATLVSLHASIIY